MTLETEVDCPFCGEQFSVVVDCSQERQEYVEDCSVCCRPIQFQVECENDELVSITLDRD